MVSPKLLRQHIEAHERPRPGLQTAAGTPGPRRHLPAAAPEDVSALWPQTRATRLARFGANDNLCLGQQAEVTSAPLPLQQIVPDTWQCASANADWPSRPYHTEIFCCGSWSGCRGGFENFSFCV